jgi:hypothetical protein
MTGILSFALSFLLMAASSADVVVVTLPAKSDITVPLSANGRAELRRDGMITHVRVDLDHLAPVATLGPAVTAYVVWGVSAEGLVENLGELVLDKDKGRLETISKFDEIGILITAEPDYMVDWPNSAVAYSSQAPKGGDIRHVSVPVEVGVYDYTRVQLPNQMPPSNLIQEARAAFQVATIAGADHWAEVEYRRAKVGLDTLEEMIPRGVPPDILAQAANETIRSSQSAAMVARQKAAAAALQEARDQATVLKQEKQDLSDRVERLGDAQTTAAGQIQKLQNDLNVAKRESQRIAAENDQSVARANKSEKELSDLKKKQDELQAKLVLQLSADYYDPKKFGLTASGREALNRLAGMADAVPGPVHIQGPAPDPVYDTARQFLIDSGVSADRIVIVRP